MSDVCSSDINKGEIILVEEKTALMKKLGRKTLTVQLSEPLEVLPKALDDWDLQLNADGHELEYVFDTKAERTGISALLGRLSDLVIGYKSGRATCRERVGKYV